MLVFQLFPSWGPSLRRLLDMRQWPKAAWVGLNVAIVMILCLMRFGPEFVSTIKSRRLNSRLSHDALEAKHKQEEQRALLRRMQEGRKRRIY
jgi:hypothetical protein